MCGMASLRGKLLVAGGSLFDPNFRKTVVLVADHDENGAAGVVLNRRAGVTVAEAAPPLAELVGPEETLYLGGPVQPQSAVVLAEFEPGSHFYDRTRWEDLRPEGPHLWRTLGYRRTVWEPGRQVVEWDASEDYGFPTNAGHIVHGGMITTLLDTAMGGACWTLLDEDEAFLTADLRVEFFRSARPMRP